MGKLDGQQLDVNPQYFPGDLFALGDDEVFVDCGAFDGDTIAEFRRLTGDQFRSIFAFEPDAGNLARLNSLGDSRISVQPYATWSKREVLRFASAAAASSVSETGSVEVPAIPLDDVLVDAAPTYIKMDIEGSELHALEGASVIIRRWRPKLAVCVYHAPDHLWRVPLALAQLLPDSHQTVRGYNYDGFDTVCYCIPR